MEQVKDAILNLIKNFGTSILEAVAILLVGIIVIKVVIWALRAVLHRSRVDNSAGSFVLSLVKVVLALVLFFIILKVFNIDASSVVAIVAASGLAVGLALQDSLSNIACGIIILFTKPFKEDDHIKIGGVEGKVKKIKVTTTELLTADNVSITVPNSKVVNSELSNFSRRPTRRVDILIPVAYESDVAAVKSALAAVIDADSRVLEVPKYEIIVEAIGGSSIDFKVKMWVNTADYWDVKNGFLEKVLAEFARQSIEIPYKKLVVFNGNKEGNND